MNRTKIEWADYTINPIKGMCKNDCFYCYAKAMYKRFKWNKEIIYNPDAFCDVGKAPFGSKIFVGSMHDIFGDWIEKDIIEIIISWTKIYPKHTFIFLTKNPRRYLEFKFPKNCWLGETIDGLNPDPDATVSHGKLSDNNIEFVSFEPLLGDMLPCDNCFDWIIIGGLTGGYKYKRPDENIKEIIKGARKFNIPIFIKDNLKWPEKIQEYPNVN